MQIFLIGYMGSGKTTVGKKLASKLGFRFIDTDTIIETNAGKSISEIFTTSGEQSFRIQEHELLKELVKNKEDMVISTGGGMPCHYQNIDIMNSAGITIYLKLSPESLAKRIYLSKKERPLLANIVKEKLPAVIGEKLAEREIFYNRAKHIVKGESLDIKKLLDILKIEG